MVELFSRFAELGQAELGLATQLGRIFEDRWSDAALDDSCSPDPKAFDNNSIIRFYILFRCCLDTRVDFVHAWPAVMACWHVKSCTVVQPGRLRSQEEIHVFMVRSARPGGRR